MTESPNAPRPEDPLIRDLADSLARTEANYTKEGSGPGSRFEGRLLEDVQAELAVRRIRANDDGMRFSEVRMITRITSIDQALAAVAEELDRLACWPEQVSVWPPGAFDGGPGPGVIWHNDAPRIRPGGAYVPDDRRSKMHHVRGKIDQGLRGRNLLHQLPDMILAASDGTVVTMWGNRTGQLTEAGMRVLRGEPPISNWSCKVCPETFERLADAEEHALTGHGEIDTE